MLFECPVELGKGLESYFEGYLTDPPVGILKEIACFLHPEAGYVFDEIDPCCFLENFAEIAGAYVDRSGDGSK